MLGAKAIGRPSPSSSLPVLAASYPNPVPELALVGCFNELLTIKEEEATASATVPDSNKNTAHQHGPASVPSEGLSSSKTTTSSSTLKTRISTIIALT